MYIQLSILEEDPFVSIEQNGIDLLMRMTIEGGQIDLPTIEIGICGEQSCDP